MWLCQWLGSAGGQRLQVQQHKSGRLVESQLVHQFLIVCRVCPRHTDCIHARVFVRACAYACIFVCRCDRICFFGMRARARVCVCECVCVCVCVCV